MPLRLGHELGVHRRVLLDHVLGKLLDLGRGGTARGELAQLDLAASTDDGLSEELGVHAGQLGLIGKEGARVEQNGRRNCPGGKQDQGKCGFWHGSFLPCGR